jgi:hypothetical protein
MFTSTIRIQVFLADQYGAKRTPSAVAMPHSHPNHVDTFHSFDIFNFDIFDFVASSLEDSATYDFVSLAEALPLLYV